MDPEFEQFKNDPGFQPLVQLFVTQYGATPEQAYRLALETLGRSTGPVEQDFIAQAQGSQRVGQQRPQQPPKVPPQQAEDAKWAALQRYSQALDAAKAAKPVVTPIVSSPRDQASGQGAGKRKPTNNMMTGKTYGP